MALANYYENDGEERAANVEADESFQDAVAAPEPSAPDDALSTKQNTKVKQNTK